MCVEENTMSPQGCQQIPLEKEAGLEGRKIKKCGDQYFACPVRSQQDSSKSSSVGILL